MAGLKTAACAVLWLLLALPIQAQEEEDSATEAPAGDAQADGAADADTVEDGSSADAGGEPTPAPTIERHQPNPDKWRLDDVTRFLTNFARNGEVLTFEQDEGQVSGLYLPENTGKPQGGVLILHDVDQHAHWPQTVAPLREYLPDYGWNTLSLFMNQGIKKPLPAVKRTQPTPSPAPDSAEPPAETGEESVEDPTQAAEDTEEVVPTEEALAEDPLDDAAPPEDELDGIADSLDEIPDLAAKAESMNEEEEEKEDPAEAYIKNSTDRVSAGINQLNTLGQFNLVIIAHGANANWAAAALNEIYERSPDAKGFALILVDARSSAYPIYPLNSMLANLDIPMLDLITINEEIPIRQSLDRRNTMRRNQRENYQQIRIPAVRSPLRGKHNTITRRIRGWLQTNAAGEEVEIKG